MGSDPEDIDRMWKRFNWNDHEKQFTKSEQPAHRVKIDGFWMYRTLVTVSQYRRYCETTGRSMPAAPSYGWKDANPVVNVSWEDARAYCSWAGGRLPYEAEWEYAARGRSTGIDRPRTTFVWGDTIPTTPVGNLADETFLKGGYYNNPNFHIFTGYTDGYVTASPVMAFPANEFGLYDMAGNVLEWCGDWSAADYYSNSPVSNPHGPATGTNRVLRGGAFDTIPTITRLARRLSNNPDIRNEEKGFRCILDK
jgi:formylglycine-generating enzyme required for sulfatase activity